MTTPMTTLFDLQTIYENGGLQACDDFIASLTTRRDEFEHFEHLGEKMQSDLNSSFGRSKPKKKIGTDAHCAEWPPEPSTGQSICEDIVSDILDKVCEPKPLNLTRANATLTKTKWHHVFDLAQTCIHQMDRTMPTTFMIYANRHALHEDTQHLLEKFDRMVKRATTIALQFKKMDDLTPTKRKSINRDGKGLVIDLTSTINELWILKTKSVLPPSANFSGGVVEYKAIIRLLLMTSHILRALPKCDYTKQEKLLCKSRMISAVSDEIKMLKSID